MVWSRFLLCILLKDNKNIKSLVLISVNISCNSTFWYMFHPVLYQINIGVYSELFNWVYITQDTQLGSMPRLFWTTDTKSDISAKTVLKGPEKQTQNKLDTPLFEKESGHVWMASPQCTWIKRLRSGTMNQTLKCLKKSKLSVMKSI